MIDFELLICYSSYIYQSELILSMINNKQQHIPTILGFNPDILAILMMISGSILMTFGFIFANEVKFNPIMTGIIRGLSGVVICYIISINK